MAGIRHAVRFQSSRLHGFHRGRIRLSPNSSPDAIKPSLKSLTAVDIEQAVGGLSNRSLKHAAALCLDAVRAAH